MQFTHPTANTARDNTTSKHERTKLSQAARLLYARLLGTLVTNRHYGATISTISMLLKRVNAK